MTKEITKASIIQEIQDKFKLREFLPAKFLFDETVVPTYDISKHLQVWGSARFTRYIGAATSYLVAAVPENERWRVRSYSVIFISGVYTIAGVYILRNNRSGADDFSYLDLSAASDVSYLVNLPESVVVEPKDELRINVDGFTSAGNVYIYIDYMKEEIR